MTTDMTHDLRLVAIDNASYAEAVAAARAFRVGDDPADFAFTGTATLMFQREDAAWSHEAFSSTPLIRHVNPIEGTSDGDAAQSEDFLRAVADQVSYLHIPAECQAMQIDDVWGIDCEFLMFALPHPEHEGESAWLLVPGPEGRVISSQHTVQDYQFAEIQAAAKDLGV